MKNLKIYTLILSVILLSSCARGCQSFERGLIDNKSQPVKVTMYSGGDTVGHWDMNSAIINSSQSSDGYYFYNNNNKLIEVSGDVVIEYK